MIEDPYEGSIQCWSISAHNDEIINVCLKEDIMTVHSSLPHTFLVSNFSTNHRETSGGDTNSQDPQENQAEW